MKRGGKMLCGVAVFAIAACAGEPGSLQIRPTPTPLAQGERPVSFRVAEARGQLALGNVGLALESFRKAAREDPASIDALTGIAACYDRMGRFDLSRRNYEAALALAPGDTQLLAEFAGSLDLQGRRDEAASVRIEIAQRLAPAAPAAPVELPAPVAAVAAAVIPAPVAAVAAAVVPAPVAVVAPVAAVADVVDVAPVAPAPQLVAKIRAPVAPQLVAEAPAPVAPPAPVSAGLVAAAEVPAAPAPIPPIVMAEAAPPQVGPTVTIKLPPPRPISAPVAEPEAKQVASALPPSRSTQARKVAAREQDLVKTGPRIERLSMGEVALVTVAGPRWRSEAISSSARSTTVRFVPLRRDTDMAEVRLLNAARVHRLAARTRAYLSGRGWRSIDIGDAESTRARSIIFYPAGQRSVARKLSAQFGFAIAPHQRVQQVTVLLGRDSVRIAGARAGA